jgi:hypothetical protein
MESIAQKCSALYSFKTFIWATELSPAMFGTIDFRNPQPFLNRICCQPPGRARQCIGPATRWHSRPWLRTLLPRAFSPPRRNATARKKYSDEDIVVHEI